tara:strand:+ start:102 stop:578 length:477 start_codon:yes stop_codon:yes gene_type:complete
MEINMTNSNDKYDTAKRWEDIKQRYLDRADVISELEEDELEAANSLHWSACSLSESVNNLLRLQYDDVVDFSDAYSLLKGKYDWDTSECEDKSKVMKMCSKVVDELESEYPRLSMRDVEQFNNVSGKMYHFFDTKPNQHQIGKFEEHGITWDGEVDEH